MIESYHEINTSLRQRKKYKDWVQKIRERDKNICKECKLWGTNEAIPIHHIVSVSVILEKNLVLNTKQAMDCEDLWDLSNGESLCEECHRNKHRVEKIKPKPEREKDLK